MTHGDYVAGKWSTILSQCFPPGLWKQTEYAVHEKWHFAPEKNNCEQNGMAFICLTTTIKEKKKSRCYPFFWIITLHNKHSEVAKILAYIICQLHCYQNRNDLAISLSRISHITMQLINEKKKIKPLYVCY